MDRKLGHGPHVKWLWARGLGPDQTDVKYRETSAHTESFGGQKTNLRKIISWHQGDYDGRGQPTASPMLTAIFSGGVGISGRELYKYR